MIKPKQRDEFVSAIDQLLWVMESLRDKENGCPWDIEQDFKSILPYTIEEAYEVADAIERDDMDDLREELGDLLLQVVYHAQMAKEAGHFDFSDVSQAVSEKMISRHPHVFGDKQAANADAVNDIWDQQKEAEKAVKGALDNVTKGLPSLLRAQKLQKKAAKTGFEWENSDQAYQKFEEELKEFHAAKTDQEKEEEFGDVLIALANYGRMQGINAEEALRKANEKFIKRFTGVENEFRENGLDLKEAALEDMLASWNRQKSK